MSSKAVSKGIISVGTWSATKLVVSGLVLPVYSRVLGIEGYGQYAYYMALLLLSSHPANFGMTQMLIKHIAERPDERPWHRALAGFAGSVNLVSAGVVGLGLACLLLFSSPIDMRAVLMTGVVIGVLWCDQLVSFANGILYGLHQEEKATIPAALGVVIGGALGVALTAGGWGVLGSLLGLLIAGIIVAMVTLGRAVHALGPRASGRTHDLPQRQLWQFGMSSMVYAGVAMMLYSIDVVLVRHFAGDEQTGLYAAAVQWSEFVWFLPIAVEGVMLQSTSRLWTEGRVEDVTRLVSALLRYIALATAFLLIFVMIFAKQILAIYFGQHFQDAATALQIMIPGAFACSLARVMRPVIQSRGYVITLIKIVLFGTGINISLNVWLVPRWGAAGAAIATSVSFVSVALLYWHILHQEGAHPFRGFSTGRFLVLCGVTAGLLAVISNWMPSPALSLLVGGATAMGLYWAGVFWLGLIRVEELGRIVESLPRPLRNIGARVLKLLQPMLIRIEAMALG